MGDDRPRRGLLLADEPHEADAQVVRGERVARGGGDARAAEAGLRAGNAMPAADRNRAEAEIAVARLELQVGREVDVEPRRQRQAKLVLEALEKNPPTGTVAPDPAMAKPWSDTPESALSATPIPAPTKGVVPQ